MFFTAAIGAGTSPTGPPASARISSTKARTAQDQAVQQQLLELSRVDQHVRSHEQAHLAAAGPYATGSPSFEFVYGPDGKGYAVAGEVGVDTSPVAGDPEATVEKARVVQAAANAPVDPSAQDRQVAASAAQMEQQALMEIAARRYQETGAGLNATISVMG
jgi:hypothetical protein